MFVTREKVNVARTAASGSQGELGSEQDEFLSAYDGSDVASMHDETLAAGSSGWIDTPAASSAQRISRWLESLEGTTDLVPVGHSTPCIGDSAAPPSDCLSESALSRVSGQETVATAFRSSVGAQGRRLSFRTETFSFAGEGSSLSMTVESYSSSDAATLSVRDKGSHGNCGAGQNQTAVGLGHDGSGDTRRAHETKKQPAPTVKCASTNTDPVPALICKRPCCYLPPRLEAGAGVIPSTMVAAATNMAEPSTGLLNVKTLHAGAVPRSPVPVASASSKGMMSEITTFWESLPSDDVNASTTKPASMTLTEFSSDFASSSCVQEVIPKCVSVATTTTKARYCTNCACSRVPSVHDLHWRGTLSQAFIAKYEKQVREHFQALDHLELMMCRNKYDEFQQMPNVDTQGKVVEVYGFDPELRSHNFTDIFDPYIRFKGATIRWVDDSHLLLILATTNDCNEVLHKPWPGVQVQSIANGSPTSILKFWLYDLGGQIQPPRRLRR